MTERKFQKECAYCVAIGESYYCARALPTCKWCREYDAVNQLSIDFETGGARIYPQCIDPKGRDGLV